MVFATPKNGTASKPCAGKNALKNSLCVRHGAFVSSFDAPTAPQPYAKKRNGI